MNVNLIPAVRTLIQRPPLNSWWLPAASLRIKRRWLAESSLFNLQLRKCIIIGQSLFKGSNNVLHFFNNILNNLQQERSSEGGTFSKKRHKIMFLLNLTKSIPNRIRIDSNAEPNTTLNPEFRSEFWSGLPSHKKLNSNKLLWEGKRVIKHIPM